jgi:hypothetical protein
LRSHALVCASVALRLKSLRGFVVLQVKQKMLSMHFS